MFSRVPQPPLLNGGPIQQTPVTVESQGEILHELSPEELKEHFVELIANEWKKKIAVLDPFCNKTVAAFAPFEKEFVLCHTKFRVSDVPKLVIKQVTLLSKKRNECFCKFFQILKDEVNNLNFVENVKVSKNSKDVEGATEMLAELAVHRLQLSWDQYTSHKESTSLKVKINRCDTKGELWIQHHLMPADIDFSRFIEDMETNFPTLCFRTNKEDEERWNERIARLREISFEGDHEIVTLERLIADHVDTRYEALAQWMFIRQGTTIGHHVQTEEQFNRLMDLIKNEQLDGCLTRVREAKIGDISSTLASLERAMEETKQKTKQGIPAKTECVLAVSEDGRNSVFENEHPAIVDAILARVEPFPEGFDDAWLDCEVLDEVKKPVAAPKTVEGLKEDSKADETIRTKATPMRSDLKAGEVLDKKSPRIKVRRLMKTLHSDDQGGFV